MPTPESPQLPNNPEDIALKQELESILLEGKRLVAEGRSTTDQEERNRILEEVKDIVLKAKDTRKKLGISTVDREGIFTPEQYIATIHPFLLEIYKIWSYNADQLKIVAEVISNTNNIHIGEPIPFEELKKQNEDPSVSEANKKKIGEIYLSGESPDFEKAKPYIPDIPEKIKAQGVSGVLKYIYETYKDKYILPDIKYYQYLIKLGDKYKLETDSDKKTKILKQIPEQLRDHNYYFFPRSAFVSESGFWVCPRSLWFGGEFLRYAFRLGDAWDSNYRVVLLER